VAFFALLAQLAIAAVHFQAHKSRYVRTVSKGIYGANASIAVLVLPTVSEPVYYGGGWSAPTIEPAGTISHSGSAIGRSPINGQQQHRRTLVCQIAQRANSLRQDRSQSI